MRATLGRYLPLIGVVSGVLSPCALGGTLLVPSQYATIQAGIDAAVAGDTVLVADGTYTGAGNKDLDFHGKAITVRSASGNPALCIIDCQNSGRGFYFHSAETAASIVGGFTIRNGYVSDSSPGFYYGGGVHCLSSSPTLTNCTIGSNEARYGGGVYCAGSSSRPTLTNCTISGNTAAAPSGQGGGVFCSSLAGPSLTNCTISENRGYLEGGGVYCESSGATLTNCTISGNAASSAGGAGCDSFSSLTLTNCTISRNVGGGVRCGSSSTTLTNCTISRNVGGGVSCVSSSPRLSNCMISENTAYRGAGVYCGFSGPTLTNCTISRNTASYGGAVYCIGSPSPTLTNCTISGNTASVSGGAVYCDSSSPNPKLANCILWADTPQEVYVYSGTPVVTYCDVQDGYTGTGNISVDPGYAFADDFHLTATSPCIDGGTSAPTGGLPAQDADGNPRPLDGNGDGQAKADMGAYEFNPTAPTMALSPTRIEFFIVEGQAEPQTQTLSIRNAGGGTLRWALDWDADWLQVDRVQGESTGEVGMVTMTADASTLSHGAYSTVLTVSDPQASNDPRVVEVALYVNKTLYVPIAYPTIQAAIDAAVPGDEVLVANGTYTGAGNKDLDFGGKAIMVRSASADPAACVIDCEGSGRGFLFHSGETAETVVAGFTIRNALVTDMGGAVYCYYSNPMVTNCTIVGNTAFYGGGVFCYYSSPTVTNCTISGNTASLSTNPGYGGGVYCSWSSPRLANCVITRNEATGSGGGVSSSYSNPELSNCTITGNTSSSASSPRGGGVYCSGSTSRLLLTNCVHWANTPQEIYVSSGTVVVTYCDVQGGYTGTGNMDVDPLFVDPDGPDDDPATWQDNDYRLAAGSPCIDAGNNAAVPAGVVTDLDGHPRFVDDPYRADTGNPGDPPRPVVDMGAYEVPFLRGDADCDGVVDLEDINPFVMALVSQATYEARYPGCPWLNADVNGDGAVDFDDINPFVKCLVAGGCL